MIKKYIPTQVKILKKSNDPRSYRQNSSKLIRAGFKREFSVKDAIKELVKELKINNFKNNLDFYRIKKMKKIGSKILND